MVSQLVIRAALRGTVPSRQNKNTRKSREDGRKQRQACADDCEQGFDGTPNSKVGGVVGDVDFFHVVVKFGTDTAEDTDSSWLQSQYPYPRPIKGRYFSPKSRAKDGAKSHLLSEGDLKAPQEGHGQRKNHDIQKEIDKTRNYIFKFLIAAGTRN